MGNVVIFTRDTDEIADVFGGRQEDVVQELPRTVRDAISEIKARLDIPSAFSSFLYDIIEDASSLMFRRECAALPSKTLVVRQDFFENLGCRHPNGKLSMEDVLRFVKQIAERLPPGRVLFIYLTDKHELSEGTESANLFRAGVDLVLNKGELVNDKRLAAELVARAAATVCRSSEMRFADFQVAAIRFTIAFFAIPFVFGIASSLAQMSCVSIGRYLSGELIVGSGLATLVVLLVVHLVSNIMFAYSIASTKSVINRALWVALLGATTWWMICVLSRLAEPATSLGVLPS